ncbi:MAG TPA: WD40 repeat domain-containing protein, partial [Sandaracinaceae bacterium]
AHALAAHGDALFVADAFDHRVRRHALPSLARAALPGPDARLKALVVSPDERHALSCGWDGKAELWELASGRRIRELRGPAFPSGGSAQAGCFLPDGSVVIAFGPELRCFAPDRDEPVWSRRHEHGWDISLLVASRDGSVVVACDAASRRHYGHLSVIDAGSGHERSMKQLSWTVQHAQLDGDRVLLLGSAGALTLDPATGEIVKERRVEGSYWGTGMVLSPDGRTCTRPASRIVRETRWTVHDLERDEAVVTIDPGEGSYPAAFALDGAVLVVTTSDGLRYFDAASGAALGEVALGRRPLLVRSLRDRELVALDSGALYLVDRPAMEPPRREQRAASGEDVLALFEVEPSADAWRQACAALERVDDPAVLEQVERACERWPDHLRTAPSGWIDDAISGRAQPRLRIVRTLRTKHLRSSGARALASIPDLRLAILDVKEGELDDADALALAHRWPDLEELRLRRVGLGPKAAKGLASVPFTRLARLDLSGNALTGPSVAALLASPALARLRYLALDRNPKLAHPKSIEAIATSPQLAGLHALDLEFTGVPVAAIVRAEHLTHLRSLAIDGAMSDDDLAAIARAPHLARLEHLELGSQHAVTAAGLAALDAGLTSLRTFSIYVRDHTVLAACPRLSEARERHRERLEAGHRSWGWLFERERIV